MKKVTSRQVLFFIAFAIAISVVVLGTSAQYFRFVPTHKIVKNVQCFTCHSEELKGLNENTHIKKMPYENRSIIDYYGLYGDSYRKENKTNTTLLKDACYSCHLSYSRYSKFSLSDPFVFYNKNGGSYDAIYNVLGLWAFNSTDIEHVTGNGSNTPGVNLKVESMAPENSSVLATVKLVYANFSGQQANTTFEKVATLKLGENASLESPPVYGDYFRIVILLDGAWANLTVNITVNGTNNRIEPYLLAFSTTPAFFTLPNDYPENYDAPYFHTEGIYKHKRLDSAWRDFKNSTAGNISALEGMNTSVKVWSNGLITWKNSYTCSSPNAMCHINQKAAYIGEISGLPDGEAFYKHEMAYSTPSLCSRCHL